MYNYIMFNIVNNNDNQVNDFQQKKKKGNC